MENIYDKALTEWRCVRRGLYDQRDHMSEIEFYSALDEAATKAIDDYPIFKQLIGLNDLPIPTRIEARRKLEKIDLLRISVSSQGGLRNSNVYYDAGFQSYSANNGALVNPYPTGSDAHFQFERGWAQALRRQPNSAFRSTSDGSSSSHQEYRSERLSGIANNRSRSVNRYAEAKGKPSRKQDK